MNNKEDLPTNWFKRYSRKRYRGKEYFYNKKTKQKSWDHPNKNISKDNVVQWLNKNETELTDNSLVPGRIPDQTQLHNLCSVSSESRNRLENEYKKFEESLADIESDVAIDTMNLQNFRRSESGCNTSSIDSLSEDMCSSQFSSMNGNYHAQFISMNDEKAIQEVSLIRRHHEDLMNRQIFGNIYQEPALRSFYIIIDTNIFLSQMKFLGNLLNKIDEVPGRPMLVIPYVVLQELDILKMRTENETSILALQAIAFICGQLKMVPNKFCGQSAMDNGRKLIDIQNANDSIINCCLQFKQNFGNVMLLTNDMSLSNKAICSHVDAFSKNEFEAIFLKFQSHLVVE